MLLRKDCDNLKFLKIKLLNLFDILVPGTNGKKQLKIILNMQRNNQRKNITKLVKYVWLFGNKLYQKNRIFPLEVQYTK